MKIQSPTSSTGGIYIASNVADSTRVWKCEVTNDEIIGKKGMIEPMREFLPTEGVLLKPGNVYWMSDRAPHESLPMKVTTMRQFFRIMTSEVEFWFKDLYTANPLGVLPDQNVTEIVAGKDSSNVQIVQGQRKTLKDAILQGVPLRRREEQGQEITGNNPLAPLFNGCVLDGGNPYYHREQRRQRKLSKERRLAEEERQRKLKEAEDRRVALADELRHHDYREGIRLREEERRRKLGLPGIEGEDRKQCTAGHRRNNLIEKIRLAEEERKQWVRRFDVDEDYRHSHNPFDSSSDSGSSDGWNSDEWDSD